MLLRDDRVRPHHYRFAHGLLSRMLLNPRWDLRSMAERGVVTSFLHFVWDDLGQQFPAEERVGADGLSGELATAGQRDVLLVTMPAALHMAEAHFVAVTPVEPASARRFLTLEHSWTVDDRPATVLGEWTDGAHVNMGPGPEPTAAAFLGWIATRPQA